MSQADDRACLNDILKAARLVKSFVDGMDEADFLLDPKSQAAVHYQLMIVGEATKKLSDAYRKAHPEIPWKKMAGMRDVLIHDYGDIDLQAVWLTATLAVPLLINQMEPLTER